MQFQFQFLHLLKHYRVYFNWLQTHSLSASMEKFFEETSEVLFDEDEESSNLTK